MAQKFVVEGYRFKMSSSVDNHSELVKFDAHCKGGGWFYLDDKEKILMLYSKSYDYGRAKREDILMAFKDHLFSSALEGFTIVHSTVDNLSYAMSSIEDKLDHTAIIGTVQDMSFVVDEAFKHIISE